jgi:hypothetical protein
VYLAVFAAVGASSDPDWQGNLSIPLFAGSRQKAIVVKGREWRAARHRNAGVDELSHISGRLRCRIGPNRCAVFDFVSYARRSCT